METWSPLLAICAGNSSVSGEFPTHKGQWRGALMFSLICAWINAWVNNRGAGDLRRQRAHYKVTVMIFVLCLVISDDIFKVVCMFLASLRKWFTQWRLVTHIYWVIIGSSNVLSPVQHHAITYGNTDFLSIPSLGTNSGEIWIKHFDFHTRKAL